MTDFIMSGQEVFGKYCKIANGYPFGGEQGYHIYKCIQSLRSNTYCDTPITAKQLDNPGGELHDCIVDVVRVIHCGICEDQVLTVALDDIEFVDIPNTIEQRYQQLEQVAREMYWDVCNRLYYGFETVKKYEPKLRELGVELDG